MRWDEDGTHRNERNFSALQLSQIPNLLVSRGTVNDKLINRPPVDALITYLITNCPRCLRENWNSQTRVGHMPRVGLAAYERRVPSRTVANGLAMEIRRSRLRASGWDRRKSGRNEEWSAHSRLASPAESRSHFHAARTYPSLQNYP